MAEKEYIEREAVLNQMLYEMVGTGFQSKAMSVTQYANAADVVEVRRGEWRKENNSTYVCSCCSDRVGAFIAGTSNYCSNCGAKMDGRKEDDGK